MDTIRAGLIYFHNNTDTLIGLASFEGSRCNRVVINFVHLDHLIETELHGLIMRPEYLEHVMIGGTEKFWNEFLARTNTFIKFTPTKDYTRKEFNEHAGPLLPYLKSLINGS